jgi:polyisoprenoid-binding protein YceI
MKTMLISFLVLLFSANVVYSQKYMTKNGHIRFYSSTPMEDIEAHNRQVNAALDATTGDFVFKVLIKSFEFEKALMQEHFNENYMESHKFPNATFQGKITNLSEMNFAKDGTYNANIEGKLTIHGVTKDISEKGTFTVKDGVVQGFSKFNVKVADYEIKIPGAVVNNIAESIEVTVDVKLEGI